MFSANDKFRVLRELYNLRSSGNSFSDLFEVIALDF